MSTSKKDAAIKARKTTLSNKTKEELVEIILRKDKTEQKNSVSIQNLKNRIKDIECVLGEQESLKQKLNEELEVLCNENSIKDKTYNELVAELNDKFESIKHKCFHLRKSLKVSIIVNVILTLVIIAIMTF